MMLAVPFSVLLSLLATKAAIAGPIESRSAGVNGYSWAGCYNEPRNLGYPWLALTAKSTSKISMTVEYCSSFCADYSIFGVENGNACYCGNYVQPGTTLAFSTQCMLPCSGNFFEQCGGLSQLGLYLKNGAALSTAASSTATAPVTSTAKPSLSTTSSCSTATGKTSTTTIATITSTSSVSSTTTVAVSSPTPTFVQSANAYSFGGCITEPFFNGIQGSRALTGNSTISSDMTVEYCASYCSGYTYFGVEYGDECYCGNSFSNGTTADVTTTNCGYTCAGNSSEYCGGAGHFLVYQQPSGTASALPKALNPPVVVPSSGNYTFVACAIEPVVNGGTTRALTDLATVNGTGMTVEYCANFCSAYSFFGVEYSSECYCGNTIANGTTIATTDACSYSCSGNITERCGGADALNLYEQSSLPKVSLPTTYSAPPATATSTTISTVTSSTATTTATTTATPTPAPSAAPPAYNATTCTSFNTSLGLHGIYNFNLYSTSINKIANPINPGNLLPLLFPPFVLRINSAQAPSVCQAAQVCAVQAGCSSLPYLSFDLHWRTDKAAWECVLYQGRNTAAGWFNVLESSVSYGYGFSGAAWSH